MLVESLSTGSSFGNTGHTFSAPKLDSLTVDTNGCVCLCRLFELVDEDDDENFFVGRVWYFTWTSGFVTSLDISILSQASSSNKRRAGPLNDDKYSATVASVDVDALKWTF